jgi:DNA polymerase IIIc chi subunit
LRTLNSKPHTRKKYLAVEILNVWNVQLVIAKLVEHCLAQSLELQVRGLNTRQIVQRLEEAVWKTEIQQFLPKVTLKCQNSGTPESSDDDKLFPDVFVNEATEVGTDQSVGAGRSGGALLVAKR